MSDTRKSSLFALEVRRHRGLRSLTEVADRSRHPDLASRVQSIDVFTLRRLEEGRLEPDLAMLTTLSVVLRVPVQEFLDAIVQDRMLSRAELTGLPDSTQDVSRSYQRALRDEAWLLAVALAARGEQLTESSEERLDWRANRAIALERAGACKTAIAILTDCVNDRELRPGRRHVLYRALADAYTSAGLLRSARDAVTQALTELPELVDAEEHCGLLLAHARLLLIEAEDACERGGRADRTEVEKALVSLEEARAVPGPLAGHWTVRIELLLAMVMKHLGDVEGAELRLRDVVETARRRGLVGLEVAGLLQLGRLHRQRGRGHEALAWLRKAEPFARRLDTPDEVFDVYYELFRTALEVGDAAQQHYFRECEQRLSLVQARSPSVLQFEEMIRRAAAS
ncbi:MAG: hypothetical protein AAF533_23175 [Acidobacteriota bacterium]